jgi:hypothetical protein
VPCHQSDWEGCPAETLERIVDNGGDWRQQAHALVSLARSGRLPQAPRRKLSHPVWQARAYAASAAKTLKEDPPPPAQDKDPNAPPQPWSIRQTRRG